ncbi:MAG: hypothetical protein Q9164_002339 [Protoblastenia rupestris]
MKRIRLQIQIIPRDEPTSPPSSNTHACRDEVRPWTQPETAEITLQQLVDNIVERYGRIYVGRGTLKIKELQDSWGSTLDLTDTVGDVFDDRSSSGDILTSICKVLRYPPDPAESLNPQRYSSLLPESSARPRKRPFVLPISTFQSAQRPLPSIENWDTEDRSRAQGSAIKRQRINDARTPNHHAKIEICSASQLQGHGLSDSLQLAATQSSEHQVEDSQRSPQNKIPNPYGTPTSLSFNRLPNFHNSCRTDEAIPDSPTGRPSMVTDVDREETKSESPELRLSVHEIAPLGHVGEPKDGIDVEQREPAILIKQSGDTSHPSVHSQEDTNPRRSEGETRLEATAPPIEEARDRTSQNPCSSAMAWRDSRKTPKTVQRTVKDVYDPIESDSENFQEKQRMFNAKRLGLSKTPTRNVALPQVNKGRSSHGKPQFRVPTLPDKRQTSLLGEPARSPSICEITPSHKFIQQLMRAAAEKEVALPTVNDTLLVAKSSHTDSSAPRLFNGREISSCTNSSHTSKTHAPTLDSRDSKRRPNGDLGVEQDPLFNIYTNPSERALLSKDDVISNVEGIANEQRKERKDQGVGKAQDLESPPSMTTAETESGSTQNIDEIEDIVQSSQPKTDDKSVIQTTSKGACEGEGEEGGSVDTTHACSDAKSDKRDNPPRQPKITPRSPSQADERHAQPSKILGLVDLKNQKLKEQQLTEQAEKMMIAADGAKQLEAERSKLNKITPKRSVNTRTPETFSKDPPRTPAQQAAHTLREQQQAAALRFREERFGSVLSGDGFTETSHNKNGDQLRSSSSVGGSSQVRATSPVSSEICSDRRRRTLTPLLPGSTSSNLRAGNGIATSPLSTKSPNGMSAPLRSAMKHPASALRRSVSQVSFGGTQTTSPPVSRKSSTTSMSRPRVAVPLSVVSTPKTISRKKVQSTLNVTRDKKMKGRVHNPPSPAKPESKKEQVTSSDDDERSASSYLSEEDIGYGIAKAGPSSRKRSSFEATHTASLGSSTPKFSSSYIDPALQALSTAVPLVAKSKSPSASFATRESIFRSPAQVSNAISVTSGSSSESRDNSETSKNEQSPRSRIEPSTTAALSAKASTAPKVATQLSQASSTSSGQSTRLSMLSDVYADEQLHRETQASLPSAQKRKSVKLRPDGLLPNGTRPANFKFPSLSQMKRDAEGRNNRPLDPLVKGASKKASQSFADLEICSGTSDDETESESDDQSERITKRQATSGFKSGMRGLLKIINGSNIGKK